MPRNLKLIIPLLVVCLLSWGCSKETPVAPPAPPAKKAPAPKPTPAVTAAQEESKEPPKYVYNPVGRRDPFSNPIQSLGAQVQDEESLTPLQKVDLGQLRVIGIIIGRGEPTAMVVGPGGKSYILKKGVKVGKNDGVVIGIGADSIKIREKLVDFSGEVRTNIQELQLPKRGGVK